MFAEKDLDASVQTSELKSFLTDSKVTMALKVLQRADRASVVLVGLFKNAPVEHFVQDLGLRYGPPERKTGRIRIF
jgi:hypothetical protein